MKNPNEISNIVIGKAIEIHSALGPGLLESAYQRCLFYELRNSGLFVEKEKELPIVYKDLRLDYGYLIDLLVEN
jgi:GxxExxY protein